MARFRNPADAGFAAGMSGGGDFDMGDWGGTPGMQPGMQHLLLAEILGLAMARRAADILDRHRAALMGAPAGGSGGSGQRGETRPGGLPEEADDAQFALDNAIFTAVLDAANECLGQFDARPSDERWCDALLQLIQLAQVATDPAGPGRPG
jgi:hypothetical protein